MLYTTSQSALMTVAFKPCVERSNPMQVCPAAAPKAAYRWARTAGRCAWRDTEQNILKTTARSCLMPQEPRAAVFDRAQALRAFRAFQESRYTGYQVGAPTVKTGLHCLTAGKLGSPPAARVGRASGTVCDQLSTCMCRGGVVTGRIIGKQHRIVRYPGSETLSLLSQLS